MQWPPKLRVSAIAPAQAENLNHIALSAAAFAGVLLGVAGVVQLFGDPGAASPRRIVALNGAGAPVDNAFRAPLSDVVMDPMAMEDAAAVDPELAFATEAAPHIPLPEAPPMQAGPRVAPLLRAPLAKISAPGPNGVLPVIAADGTTAMRAYRRPFTGDASKPRIGIVVGGLGFNARTTQSAIDELPADVTLSFVPYADNLQSWIDKARAKGHEVMIELPMEPFDPDTTDTGPQTLTSTASPKENIAKLDNLLSRASGYFGVSNYQGAKFAMSGQASAPVVKALKDRGLAFVSNGIGQRAALGAEAQRAGLPFTAADRILDAQREAEAIDEQLMTLETMAQRGGSALGAGFAYPVTIEQIKTWAQRLEQRGYVLAPASAVVEARTRR